MPGPFSLQYVEVKCNTQQLLCRYLVRYLAALCKCDFGAEEPEGGQKEFPTVSGHSLIDKPVSGL